MKVALLSTAPHPRDPATDAARLLGWFGLAVLMVGAPLVGLLSRGALIVLLPVGAAILGAATLLSISGDGLTSIRNALRHPLGLSVLFLAGWAALSLIWTPYPEIAGPRLASIIATLAVAAVVIAHLPERQPSRTLSLLPGGVAVTALATLALAFLGPDSFRGGTEFDPSLLERSVLTLVVLMWPALGALVVVERWPWAAGLAVLVAVTLAAAWAQIAMAVFMIGAVTFAAAVGRQRLTARVAAGVFGPLLLLAPLLPFALAPLAHTIPIVGHSTVAAMTDWRDLVSEDPVRLITGHGLDSVRHGVLSGVLPGHTPRTILFELWFDLGALGVFAFAGVFVMGLLAAGEAADFVAPPLLAGIVATLSVAVFGVATAQLWFITLAGLQAIAFGLLARSSRSHRRVLAPAETAARPTIERLTATPPHM